MIAIHNDEAKRISLRLEQVAYQIKGENNG